MASSSPPFDPALSGGYIHRFLFKGLDNEAYFSAEQSPPEAHAWLPRPHAHEGRSAGAFAPPPQGPQAPGGVTRRTLSTEALPKEKRLAKRREFLRVYETGRKLFSRYTVLFFTPNDLPFSRLGITATKKIGKANVRNRLKRWSREVYRRQRGPLALDERAIDVVLNMKPNAADATFQEFGDDVTRLLARVAGEAKR